MCLHPDVIDALAAAGATVTMIAAAYRAAWAAERGAVSLPAQATPTQAAKVDKAEAKRAYNRERSRKIRETERAERAAQMDLFPASLATDNSKQPLNNIEQLRTTSAAVSSPSSFPPTPPIITTPPSIDDDASRAPPKKSLITPEAYELADTLMRLQRLDPEDPRMIGVAYTAQAWLTKGWQAEVIAHAVELVMGRIPAAPRRLRYFEMAIAEAHAERDRGLPVANVAEFKPGALHGAYRKTSRGRGAMARIAAGLA